MRVGMQVPPRYPPGVSWGEGEWLFPSCVSLASRVPRGRPSRFPYLLFRFSEMDCPLRSPWLLIHAPLRLMPIGHDQSAPIHITFRPDPTAGRGPGGPRLVLALGLKVVPMGHDQLAPAQSSIPCSTQSE